MVDKEGSIGAFEHLIDRWVLDAVLQRKTSFDALLLALPSVYPAAVLHALERLTAAQLLPPHIVEQAWVFVRQSPTRTQEQPHDGLLPVPHPLDYEWRFTSSATQYLLTVALALSGDHDTLALLGVPSVFRAAISVQSAKRRFVLVDANRGIIGSLGHMAAARAAVIEWDMLDGHPPGLAGTAKVVMADAPWYPPHLHTFLHAASMICAVGGHVLVCVPPVGTRPSIPEEREYLFQHAKRLALRLTKLSPVELPYASPPFERNALRAEGILNYPSHWRRGNLMLFKKMAEVNVPFPICGPHPPKWTEESIRGVRIRVRDASEDGFADPTLISVIAGDVLPSVSRRDERRRFADVWTAGNRIFRCAGRSVFQQILCAVAHGRHPAEQLSCFLERMLTQKEIGLVARATRQLNTLIKIEHDELSSYAY